MENYRLRRYKTWMGSRMFETEREEVTELGDSYLMRSFVIYIIYEVILGIST
jgi:hypothetical protein